MRRTLLDRSRGLREPLLVVPHDASRELRAMAIHEGGWVCDGEADQEEINAALSDAGRNGGRVLCAAGTYRITAPILLRSNVELEFAQGNRVVVPADHQFEAPANQVTMFTDTVPVSALIRNEGAGDSGDGNTRVVIRGIRLDAGQGVGDPAIYATDIHHIGILLDQCTDSLVEDCMVEGVAYATTIPAYARNYGVCLTRCERVHVHRCEANECGYEGFSLRGTNAYCTVSNCTGVKNRVHLAQAARWHGEINTGEGQHDILFRGLHSAQARSTGQWSDDVIFHGRIDAPLWNSSIQRSHVKAGLRVTGHIYACSFISNVSPNIGIHGSADGETVEQIVLQGNTCEAPDGAPVEPGITLRADTNGAAIRRVLLQGNTIRYGCARLEIAANADGTVSQVTMQGNNFLGKSGGLRYPVHLWVQGNGDISEILIAGNYLATNEKLGDCRCVSADLASGSTGNIKKIHIANNYMYSTNGFQLYTAAGSGSVTDVSLIGNTFDLYSNPLKGGAKLNRVAILNNVMLAGQTLVNGAIDDILLHGNVLTNMTNFFVNSPTNLTIGVNPSWKGGVGKNGAWRLKQDDADVDTMYIQKLISDAWTTAGTFDASPTP